MLALLADTEATELAEIADRDSHWERDEADREAE